MYFNKSPIKIAYFILIVCLLVSIFPIQFAYAAEQAKAHPIEWNTEKIERTLYPGDTESLTVSFVSNKDLSNVDLWIVPELQRFVTVKPNHYDSINADEPYEVSMEFSIPVPTQCRSYDGTLHIRTGKKTHLQTLKIVLNIVYEDVSIPSTTKVLDESSTEHLSEVAPDGTMTFDTTTPDIDSLTPGDVMIMGETPETPYGYLCKVDSVTTEGGQTIVETSQATLEEAIEECDIEFTKSLTPGDISSARALIEGVTLFDGNTAGALSEDGSTLTGQAGETRPMSTGFTFDLNTVLYDADGDLNTTNDQVRASGSIALELDLYCRLKMDWFKIKEFTFKPKVIETANLEISAEGSYSLEKEVEICEIKFTTIWLNAIVAIKPVLTINIGVEGQVSAEITTGITQQATLETGLSYKYGSWHPISNFSNYFDYQPPSVSASCNLKGYAGPQLDVLLYNAAGPYVQVNGYLEFDAVSVVYPEQITWWMLYAGIEVNIGIESDVLGYGCEWPGIIDVKFPLAGYTIEADFTADPLSGYEPLTLIFTDASSSYDDITSWAWDFDNDGTVDSTLQNPSYIYIQDGTYTVSLTVTGSDGSSDTKTDSITVVDTGPTSNFSATPISGDEPLTVSFTDASSSHDGIVSWAWDFDNDGTVDSTLQNPSYIYIQDGTYTVSLTVTEADGDSDTKTRVNYIIVGGVITFADSNLEAAIRDAIGKPSGDIYTTDLEGLNFLDASGRGITDISGLEYCTNLTKLWLGNNQISDLSPLANLTNLTEMYLYENQIIDLSPLSGLTSLTKLRCYDNQIIDLSPLSGLTGLIYLDFNYNQISDLSPLSDLTSLTTLYLYNNQISDLEPIEGITSLIWLNLGKNQISDLSFLSGLTSLRTLWIGDNQISDLSSLSGLTSLMFLDLGDNQISDILPLVENSGILEGDTVDLQNNPLSTTSIDIYIPALEARGVDVSY